MPLRDPQCVDELRTGRGRKVATHEVHGSLVQSPRRALFVSFNTSIDRVRHRLLHSGPFQCFRVDPRAVTVGVDEEDGAVGDDAIEIIAVRCPAWEGGH
jgi:hypothetical protein